MGLHQTPENVVNVAIQEDADAIGMSMLSGAHTTLFTRVLELLEERNTSDLRVFDGGVIPREGIVQLKEHGILEVFTPGSSPTLFVKELSEHLGPVVVGCLRVCELKNRCKMEGSSS